MYDEHRVANQGGGEGWGGPITQHRALEQPGSHVGIKYKIEYLPHTLPQNKCWRDWCFKHENEILKELGGLKSQEFKDTQCWWSWVPAKHFLSTTRAPDGQETDDAFNSMKILQREEKTHTSKAATHDRRGKIFSTLITDKDLSCLKKKMFSAGYSITRPWILAFG